MSKERIAVPMTTLDFFKYEEDGLIYYEFNATKCSPPEPMVNTMHGLKMLRSKNDRLVGTFFHEPVPLYNQISAYVSYEAIELDTGDFRVVFKLI